MAESTSQSLSQPVSLGSRLLPLVLWLIVLVPVIGCGLLMKSYVLDQRFLDDFVWAQDLIKYKEGKYAELFHDIFSVHLEHRPAVARGLALVVTLLAKGDVTSQNLLCYLWLVFAFVAFCWLWVRVGGLKIRETWPALFLTAAALFTPMQWQNLLWPICHETPMPILFLLLSLCIAFTGWKWWVRCLLAAFSAILGMLSFASGFLLWVLPLPVLLWNGKFIPGRLRFRFLVLWGLVFFVSMLVYLKVQFRAPESHEAYSALTKEERVKVDQERKERDKKEKLLVNLPQGWKLIYDLHNEVPPAYAYHHEDENTMNNEFLHFLENPVLDAQFVAVFSGAILVRGWSADIKDVSMRVGWVLLACWLASGVYLLIFRKDKELRRRLLPAFCFASYTPLTALMVAVGRIYAGGTGSALNGRYTVHQTVLLVGLVWAGVAIGRHWHARRNRFAVTAPVRFRIPVSTALGGVLAGVLAVGWVHGQAMMWEWQAGRYRAAAAQYVSQIFDKRNHFVGFVAGNFQIARETADALAKYDLLGNGVARDKRLFASFKVADSGTLDQDHAEFQRLYKAKQNPDREIYFRIGRFHVTLPIHPFNRASSDLGDQIVKTLHLGQTVDDIDWQIQGYAYLPGSQRPADAIILAYQVPGGEPTMFGLTQAYGAPHYLARSMGKDMYSLIPGRDTWPNRIMCSWDPDVHFQEEPPANALITAWAVDMNRHRIFRIQRSRKAWNDPAAGCTLAELAEDVEHDDEPTH